MENDIEVSVRRTGRLYSIASSEFEATFPDGTTLLFWSPPWHEWDGEQEERNAIEYARSEWGIRCGSQIS